MARIVHVCASPDFTQYVSVLLPQLVQAGHDVHFVSGPGPEPAEHLKDSGVVIHAISIERQLAPTNDLTALFHLTRLFRRLKPDLVHAHTPKGGLLGMMAATTARVPARIYQIHGLRYETAKGRLRSLLQNTDRLSALMASRVICVSPSVQARATSDFIIAWSKTVVFENGSAQGIDVRIATQKNWARDAQQLRQQLKLPDDSLCVVFLGRLARDKGLLDLAEAWLRPEIQDTKATLVLAGQPDDTDPVNLEHLRSLPRCHLFTERRTPEPLLALADILVLPSYREGLPQAVLEAGAFSVPVVATSVTGTIDAVSASSGVLVDAHAPAQLAQALHALLVSPEERVRLGKGGYTWVQRRFNQPKIIQRTIDLYDELLEATRE